MVMVFRQLPVLQNANGEIRKAGFELEYGQVGIEESVHIIRQLYGGRVEVENRFLQRVVDSVLGDFTVEFDSRLLTEKNYKQLFDKLNINLQEIKLGGKTLEDGVETLVLKANGENRPSNGWCDK